MNNYFTSTIFRKILAALSGLFLTLFLFGHLAGNLQLFISGVEGQTQFNKYALFMTTNPVVKILSILTYSSILLHVILTLYLAFKSRQARPMVMLCLVVIRIAHGHPTIWRSLVHSCYCLSLCIWEVSGTKCILGKCLTNILKMELK